MPKFVCTVKLGHQGAGKYIEKAYLVVANDIMDAYDKARSLPGVKKGYIFRSGASILSLMPYEQNARTIR